MKTNPVAVLIADIHYNINTLEVADQALRLAVSKANELEVPLIIAGDLHDTKANMRGECVKRLLKTVAMCNEPVWILRGNHDAINEKSSEHSLEFLGHLANLIVVPTKFKNMYLIPYDHDSERLRQYLKTIPKNSTIIMHQGVIGSEAGDYIQDKSALSKDDLAGFRVISGHYHRRQQFALPGDGLFDYIGNPYTLGFGEAEDPEKGFQVLYEDTTLEFIPTNLRVHRIIELTDLKTKYTGPTNGILWVKVIANNEILALADKKKIDAVIGRTSDYRLDLIPLELKAETPNVSLNDVIDSLSTASKEQKARLKEMWPNFLSRV